MYCTSSKQERHCTFRLSNPWLNLGMKWRAREVRRDFEGQGEQECGKTFGMCIEVNAVQLRHDTSTLGIVVHSIDSRPVLSTCERCLS